MPRLQLLDVRLDLVRDVLQIADGLLYRFGLCLELLHARTISLQNESSACRLESGLVCGPGEGFYPRFRR